MVSRITQSVDVHYLLNEILSNSSFTKAHSTIFGEEYTDIQFKKIKIKLIEKKISHSTKLLLDTVDHLAEIMEAMKVGPKDLDHYRYGAINTELNNIFKLNLKDEARGDEYLAGYQYETFNRKLEAAEKEIMDIKISWMQHYEEVLEEIVDICEELMILLHEIKLNKKMIKLLKKIKEFHQYAMRQRDSVQVYLAQIMGSYLPSVTTNKEVYERIDVLRTKLDSPLPLIFGNCPRRIESDENKTKCSPCCGRKSDRNKDNVMTYQAESSNSNEEFEYFIKAHYNNMKGDRDKYGGAGQQNRYEDTRNDKAIRTDKSPNVADNRQAGQPDQRNREGYGKKHDEIEVNLGPTDKQEATDGMASQNTVKDVNLSMPNEQEATEETMLQKPAEEGVKSEMMPQEAVEDGKTDVLAQPQEAISEMMPQKTVEEDKSDGLSEPQYVKSETMQQETVEEGKSDISLQPQDAQPEMIYEKTEAKPGKSDVDLPPIDVEKVKPEMLLPMEAEVMRNVLSLEDKKTQEQAADQSAIESSSSEGNVKVQIYEMTSIELVKGSRIGSSEKVKVIDTSIDVFSKVYQDAIMKQTLTKPTKKPFSFTRIIDVLKWKKSPVKSSSKMINIFDDTRKIKDTELSKEKTLETGFTKLVDNTKVKALELSKGKTLETVFTKVVDTKKVKVLSRRKSLKPGLTKEADDSTDSSKDTDLSSITLGSASSKVDDIKKEE